MMKYQVKDLMRIKAKRKMIKSTNSPDRGNKVISKPMTIDSSFMTTMTPKMTKTLLLLNLITFLKSSVNLPCEN
jgi:hypothetical protein